QCSSTPIAIMTPPVELAGCMPHSVPGRCSHRLFRRACIRPGSARWPARCNLLLFALNATRALGLRVAERLGVALSPHEEREFEDGEHKARPLVSVRDRDVYVMHSLHGEPGASVNDKLLRLLFFLGAVRDAGAARVTAVLPYLAYGRKDARTKPRDPLTTRYVAALFEAVGVDRVVALEVHNLAAFQNAFRCRTEHLDTAVLFARHFAAALPAATPLAVVSPD